MVGDSAMQRLLCADDLRIALDNSALEGDGEQVRLHLEPHWVAGKQKRGLENFEDLWEEMHGSR